MNTDVLLLATGCLYVIAIAWTIAAPLFDDGTNARRSCWPPVTAMLLGIVGHLTAKALS